jgi:hypothetical protein
MKSNFSEKYLKKLIGKTDVEDALKRLDKLTNEEVRMVAAQVLETTHTVDDKVARVEDKVLDVGNQVACVDDRVACVDDHVKAIDDKVAVAIDGALPSLIRQQQNIFDSGTPRGKRDKASHTTSRRRHGACEKFVIVFLRSHW